MKKLIIIAILAFAVPSFAAPLVWQTSRSAAIDTAKSEGKKIILVAGRDTCGDCSYMRNTVFESISPPIRCLLEQQFVLWYCNVDTSMEWYAYTGGLGAFTLPLISVIDPDNPDVYLERSTGTQTPDEFYSRLKAIAGSDCVTVMISGSAKDAEGNGIADVMINFSDGGGLAITYGTGYFAHPVSLRWSGTMTPYKIGYVFDPQKRSLNNVSADQLGQDYVCNPVTDPYTFELHNTGRVASLLMPQQEYDAWNGDTSGGEQADRTKITKFLYNYFKDDFDFVFLISNNQSVPPGLYYGQHQSVKSSVQGIGISLYDSTITYGSAGRLQGVMHLSYLTGLRFGPSLHELMHQWANFIMETSHPTHWGFSSGGGQLGGFKRDTLVDLGGGLYQANNGRANSTIFGEQANGGNSLPYSDIELYLMGMIDKAQVQPLIVAVNPQWTDYSTGKFSAAGFTEHTIENIIQINGDRIPSVNDSQKVFNAIAVVLTPRPLTETEWDNVDQQVVNFSLAGDDGNPSNYTFWEATSGLGTIIMDNLENSLKLNHITATAGTNGTISCTPNPVNYGGSSTCTVTPDTGYQVDTFMVNGNPAALTNNQYTFNCITANQTVTVTFRIIQFAITATDDGNGSVSCTPNPVNYGGSSICTVTPDAGYQVDTVTVDGIPATISNNWFVFSDVFAPHSISSTFALKGDVNQNHTLDLADAILILQLLSGGQPVQAISRKADVNNDGVIGLPEVIYILQKVAGIR